MQTVQPAMADGSAITRVGRHQEARHGRLVSAASGTNTVAAIFVAEYYHIRHKDDVVRANQATSLAALVVATTMPIKRSGSSHETHERGSLHQGGYPPGRQERYAV